MRGTTSDEAMEKAKKEVTQKKYERTKKRIEKKAKKGAITKNLKGSVEAKAAKDEARYQKYKSTIGEYIKTHPDKTWDPGSWQEKAVNRYKKENQ